MSLRALVLTFLSFAVLVPVWAFAQATVPTVTPWTYKQQRIAETFQGEFEEPQRGEFLTQDQPDSAIDRPEVKKPRIQRQLQPPKIMGTDTAKPSALEDMYSKRIIDELEQFGYDMFGTPNAEMQRFASDKTAPMGAVQDNFILGSGDELEIMFTGQRSDRGIYKVNSQGLILVKDFPPIPAAGRTIGQVRISIAAAAQNLHNTESYVALASVRQISVLVIGHVKKPGRQTMTVFHTVLDALMAVDGVQKTGSLRQIKLVRDGRSTIIDLYSLLLHGGTAMDLNLRDGDRLIVPAIGPTIAVAGEVKRPGIFEILPTMQGMRHEPGKRSEKLSLNEMLELGGGVLAPGKNRYLKLAVTDEGQEQVRDIQEPFVPVFSDGSILMVSKGSEKREGTVELSGHTRRPGMHALDENPTLSKLLFSEDVLGADVYPLIGAIERWDPEQLTHKILSYPLRLVLKGDYDRKLHDGDVVHVFSNKQISNLRLHKETVENSPIEVGSQPPSMKEMERVDDPIIAAFLRERSAFVRGAVRKPGAYPVGEGTTLKSFLAVAGGLALEANTANIEITSDLQGEGHLTDDRSGTQRIHVDFRDTNPDNIIIGTGDAVRINQKFKKIEDKSVLIIGEVNNPGRYDLLPGDRLSDLLERAGNFTPQAYAEGAIFSRESERLAEEARFRSQAREIKRAVAAALEGDEKKVSAVKISEARALAGELETAEGIGRITVEADLPVLKVQPELDILLEAGDRIYIPKRTLNVRVSGEVLSAANLQFRKNKTPLDYIHEAGGFTFHADKDRSFVLYPDGSAQPLQVSPWNHKATFIPPGSTIVVPRDPKPFDFIESAKNISQILSNLAVTAIFIDDVRDD